MCHYTSSWGKEDSVRGSVQFVIGMSVIASEAKQSYALYILRLLGPLHFVQGFDSRALAMTFRTVAVMATKEKTVPAHPFTCQQSQ